MNKAAFLRDLRKWAGVTRAERERAAAADDEWSEGHAAGMLLVLGHYADLAAGRTTQYGADGSLILAGATPPAPKPSFVPPDDDAGSENGTLPFD